jgi:hypothetical protein
MDLKQIEMQILTWLAILIGSLVLYALKHLVAWLGLKLDSDRQAQLGEAVGKAMTWAVTQSMATIAAKGWDHIDSKNAVIEAALKVLPTKFPDALAGMGLDINNPEDRVKIAEMMERMIPEVFASAAASPATPATAHAA